MKIDKITALVALIFLNSFASEPSAFGAGDVNNPQPYGLTKTESTLLQTKQELQSITVKSTNQADEISALRDRIDGIQSVLESISASNYATKNQLKEFEKLSENSNEFNTRITQSIEAQQAAIEDNKKSIENINMALKEISKVIDSINSSYVSKSEFAKLKGQSAPQKQADNTKTSTLSNVDLEKSANTLYKNKEYAKAKEIYEKLVDSNYKPAKNNYMIGEIEYYSKNYQNAVLYFKKSASLYDKAEYMPVLLLHSAISMENSGDKENAKKFYEAVVAKYPNTNEAKMASNKLK